MFFDSHAHLDDYKYNDDREIVIKDLLENGTDTVMNVGADMHSSRTSMALAEKYSYIYASVGVHPSETENITETDIEMLAEYSKHEKVKAIGEIGLDYYYPEPSHEIQQKWFMRQMELAVDLNMPVIIHNRDAHQDCLNMLKKFNLKKIGGIMHCFSGSVELAKEVISLGMVISLAGTVTFKNATKAVKVATEIPIEHMLIETDSPYLTPVPYRGKRNSPGYVKFVAEKIAELKGMSVEDVAKITKENAKRVYRIG